MLHQYLVQQISIKNVRLKLKTKKSKKTQNWVYMEGNIDLRESGVEGKIVQCMLYKFFKKEYK